MEIQTSPRLPPPSDTSRTGLAKPVAQAAHDAAPPAVDRAWSARLRETWQPHVQFLNTRFPNSFTVVSAIGTQMLFLEDELIRHMCRPMPSDRPDVSIGRCWSNHRQAQGLAWPPMRSRSRLPDQKREVFLCVYGVEELGTFTVWFNQTYLPEKLPDYLGNKLKSTVNSALYPQLLLPTIPAAA